MNEVDPTLMNDHSLEATATALSDALNPLAKLARGAGGGQALVRAETGIEISNAKRLRQQTYNALAQPVNKALFITGCLPPIPLQGNGDPTAHIPLYRTSWKHLACQYAINMASAIQRMKYALLVEVARRSSQRQIKAFTAQYWAQNIQPYTAKITTTQVSIAETAQRFESARICYVRVLNSPLATWDVCRRARNKLFITTWHLIDLLDQFAHVAQLIHDEAEKYRAQYTRKSIKKAASVQTTYLNTIFNHRRLSNEVKGLHRTIPAKHPLQQQFLYKTDVDTLLNRWHAANAAAGSQLERILTRAQRYAHEARRIHDVLSDALNADASLTSLSSLNIYQFEFDTLTVAATAF
ncbi:MAG: hypothetical protein QJR12_01160 [Mycobacterium sp.]|uniref:hypothetical protein n=1 Tax=Mycobacterium sp. TaxID=1785 RepID=UPI00260709BA|nr:hypothetical protein [Mycobacterium sp.]MDI3312929.1 hypothetical protein [Mycobacterium sp.]